MSKEQQKFVEKKIQIAQTAIQSALKSKNKDIIDSQISTLKNLEKTYSESPLAQDIFSTIGKCYKAKFSLSNQFGAQAAKDNSDLNYAVEYYSRALGSLLNQEPQNKETIAKTVKSIVELENARKNYFAAANILQFAEKLGCDIPYNDLGSYAYRYAKQNDEIKSRPISSSSAGGYEAKEQPLNFTNFLKTSQKPSIGQSVTADNCWGVAQKALLQAIAKKQASNESYHLLALTYINGTRGAKKDLSEAFKHLTTYSDLESKSLDLPEQESAAIIFCHKDIIAKIKGTYIEDDFIKYIDFFSKSAFRISELLKLNNKEKLNNGWSLKDPFCHIVDILDTILKNQSILKTENAGLLLTKINGLVENFVTKDIKLDGESASALCKAIETMAKICDKQSMKEESQNLRNQIIKKYGYLPSLLEIWKTAKEDKQLDIAKHIASFIATKGLAPSDGMLNKNLKGAVFDKSSSISVTPTSAPISAKNAEEMSLVFTDFHSKVLKKDQENLISSNKKEDKNDGSIFSLLIEQINQNIKNKNFNNETKNNLGALQLTEKLFENCHSSPLKLKYFDGQEFFATCSSLYRKFAESVKVLDPKTYRNLMNQALFFSEKEAAAIKAEIEKEAAAIKAEIKKEAASIKAEIKKEAIKKKSEIVILNEEQNETLRGLAGDVAIICFNMKDFINAAKFFEYSRNKASQQSQKSTDLLYSAGVSSYEAGIKALENKELKIEVKENPSIVKIQEIYDFIQKGQNQNESKKQDFSEDKIFEKSLELLNRVANQNKSHKANIFIASIYAKGGLGVKKQLNLALDKCEKYLEVENKNDKNAQNDVIDIILHDNFLSQLDTDLALLKEQKELKLEQKYYNTLQKSLIFAADIAQKAGENDKLVNILAEIDKSCYVVSKCSHINSKKNSYDMDYTYAKSYLEGFISGLDKNIKPNSTSPDNIKLTYCNIKCNLAKTLSKNGQGNEALKIYKELVDNFGYVDAVYGLFELDTSQENVKKTEMIRDENVKFIYSLIKNYSQKIPTPSKTPTPLPSMSSSSSSSFSSASLSSSVSSSSSSSFSSASLSSSVSSSSSSSAPTTLAVSPKTPVADKSEEKSPSPEKENKEESPSSKNYATPQKFKFKRRKDSPDFQVAKLYGVTPRTNNRINSELEITPERRDGGIFGIEPTPDREENEKESPKNQSPTDHGGLKTPARRDGRHLALAETPHSSHSPSKSLNSIFRE